MAYLYSALHAHTLLLDLEQLVVVANLDKINLNSSSSACSTTNLAQNYQTSISKQQQQQPTNATATATATTSLPSSTFTSQPFGQMVSALPLNESKLAKITNQRSTTTTTPSSTSSSSLFSSSNTTTLDQLNQFHKTNFLKCTNGNHTMRHDTNHVKPLVTGNPFDSYFSKLTNICSHTEWLCCMFASSFCFVSFHFDTVVHLQDSKFHYDINILPHGFVLFGFA